MIVFVRMFTFAEDKNSSTQMLITFKQQTEDPDALHKNDDDTHLEGISNVSYD